MKNMVKWPFAHIAYRYTEPVYDQWADTGEGGLYAWAVVRETEDNSPDSRNSGGCVVTTTSALVNPDTQVGGPELWGWENDEPDAVTEPLIATVFLGATNQSLVWGESDYFQVTENDLTDEGKAIVKALSHLGKVDILTFLDT